jgi:hypothetical protein
VDLLTARIDIDQLDAATRKRLGLPSKSAASGRRKGSRKEVAGPGLPVVCWTCKKPADGEATQKAHMAETGHLRYQALTG